MSTNQHFEQGLQDALKAAQVQANKEGRSIRVGSVWVNPSSASLARRPKPGDGHDDRFTARQ